jgi:ABC-2 type transport system ATP-binding protein
MKEIITINSLSKVYQTDKIALNNITTAVLPGILVGLVGANGAGKSTLIHILAGVLRPSNGTVQIQISDMQQLAWVSQVATIDWYLNVMDNVRLGARLGGASIKQSYKVAEHYMDLLQVLEFKNKSIEMLSGGQQRRVQIARALAQQAKLFILDEPTTGLDHKACIQLMDYIKSLTLHGKTVVISMHDLSLLEKYIDHVWFLNNGKLEIDLPLNKFLAQGNQKDHTLLIIEYAGAFDDYFLSELQDKGITILNTNPLKIKMPTHLDTNAIIVELLTQVKVISIQPEIHGLEQIYL